MYRKILPLAVILAFISCDDGASPDPDPDPDPVFFTLTTTLSGDGAGTVTSAPAGITCDATGADGCTAEFEEGTSVTLTASPASGHAFVEWSDACTGGGSCAITVAADAAVDAAFDDPNTASQEVGPEGGTVTSTDERVVLEIPAGALGNTETITITTLDPEQTHPPFDTLTGFDAPRRVYELGPDGLTFDVPVAVTVVPGDTAVPDSGDIEFTAPAVALLTLSDGGVVALDSLSNTVEDSTGLVRVSGVLNHFSPLVALSYDHPLSINGPCLRLSVEGVPDFMAVGESFVADVLFRLCFTDDPRRVEYTDRSQSPIEADFSPAEQPFMAGPGTYDYSGQYEYTCVAPGEGTYAALASGLFHAPGAEYFILGHDMRFALAVSKPIRCFVVPEPTPLAPAPEADDGTAGVVNNAGQVAGRSGGHPAVWLDPSEPPTLLPVDPDDPDAEGGGFAWEGSDDLSKLAGIVFDAFSVVAALWEDGVLTLPDVGEDLSSSSVSAMSGDGRFVAGTSFSNDGVNHGWAMVDGERVDPVVPMDATSAKIDDINDDGVAVGFVSTDQGIRVAAWDLLDGGQIIDLPPLPDEGAASLNGVNAMGTMVGTQSDPDTGTRQGIALVDGEWVIIPPVTDVAPRISLEGIGDNGVIACTLSDFPNNVFRSCVVAPGEDPVVLDFFDGANTIPARRGISRDGRFYIGGTDPGTGAFTEGWVLELNELVCPFCGMP